MFFRNYYCIEVRIINIMLRELEKLIGIEQFQELFNALAENREYKYSENGLNISAKSSEGQLSLQINYNNAKSEASDFTKYLESLDEDLFLEVCESLGQENIQRIHRCLEANDIESVRSGILRFKKELREILNNKINYYSKCLDSLNK